MDTNKRSHVPKLEQDPNTISSARNEVQVGDSFVVWFVAQIVSRGALYCVEKLH